MAKLEEILPADNLDELSAGELFEKPIVKKEEVRNGGIAMSSGCVSCNNGGDGGGRKLYETDVEKPKYGK